MVGVVRYYVVINRHLARQFAWLYAFQPLFAYAIPFSKGGFSSFLTGHTGQSSSRSRSLAAFFLF